MSFGSQPQSTGGGRSPGTRAHLGATSKTQEVDQDLQFEARLKAEKEELEQLEQNQARKAARRAKLKIKTETADQRRGDKDRANGLGIAFNMLPDGSEVSDTEVEQIVKSAAAVDHYWKDCGGKRAGEYKAVPLGGSVDARGRGNDPTRYLAVNARPWHTWGLLDATEAGLPGKAFLKHAVRLFAPEFERLTGIRAIIWPVHSKPNNIHPQPMMCCISAPCSRPGRQPKSKRKVEKTAGILLSHPNRRGRGHSPLDWALVGKTVCSLEHLRCAGFDLSSLTGDPLILEKLEDWIAYAEKNGNKALDLEAEKKWDECVLATLREFPEFRPYFDASWTRFKAQKDKESAAVLAEIAKDAEQLASQQWKDRCNQLERENAAIKEGAQMVHENAKALASENAALKKAQASPPSPQRPFSDQEIKKEAKSEMRRQFEVLRELESFTVALSLANTSKTPIPLKPNWEVLREKSPDGASRPSPKFFEILDQLTDFTGEAAELRHRIDLWDTTMDIEPQPPSKAPPKEPTRD